MKRLNTTLTEIICLDITKEKWKNMTKKAINDYWNSVLKSNLSEKSTMENCYIEGIAIGQTHPVWETVKSNTKDVRRGITKARVVTGTYLLQIHKCKFNKSEIDPTCPLCRSGSETLEHFLINCNCLHDARKEKFEELKLKIVSECGLLAWNKIKVNDKFICALIADCQILAARNFLPANKTELLLSIETITRELVYNLHSKRSYILNSTACKNKHNNRQ